MSKVYTGTGRHFQEVQSLPMDEEALGDIERRIKLQPHFLGEPLVVIGESSDFPRVIKNQSHDILAIDAMGKAVAVSLAVGVADAETDIHSLQLASHVGSLSNEELGRITRSFIERPANDSLRRKWEEMGIEMSEESVELSSLLAATFERDAEDYAEMINAEQRIIIAAEGFTSRLVEIIRWLNRSGVDIIGLRYRKYLVGGQEVYFAEQVVPTLDPAVDTPEGKSLRGAGEAVEPWRAKGRGYYIDRLAPPVATLLDRLLVLTRPYTFTINWNHKYYFWIRGSKRNLRIRVYNRNAIDIGFYNSSPEAVREFLAKFDLDTFELTTVGGYSDSPFITITGEHKLDDRWGRMFGEWLAGESQS